MLPRKLEAVNVNSAQDGTRELHSLSSVGVTHKRGDESEKHTPLHAMQHIRKPIKYI